MASVSLVGINKVYMNGITAVSNFNLEIEDGEFIVLLGPCGSGKSTLLKMIAGLEEITKGSLLFDDISMNERLPEEREIAILFKNLVLYPEMTVYDNLAYCLKRKKIPSEIIRNQIADVAPTLGIEDLLECKPCELSLKEEYRVGFGRALVREPKVILMDGSLSNLDPKLQEEMREDLIKLQEEMKKTIIYTTSNQKEAMSFGKRVVVLKDGIIQQTGVPEELVDNPKNKFIAEYIGTSPMRFFDGKILADGDARQIKIGSRVFPLEKSMMNPILENNYIDTEIIVGLPSMNMLKTKIDLHSICFFDKETEEAIS